MATLASQRQTPFAQARFMAITQLAVFEAVNAITGDYEPYLGTIDAPAGASADAAAWQLRTRCSLRTFRPAPRLWTRRGSLAAIADGAAKTDGMATGSGGRGAHRSALERRRATYEQAARAGRAGRMAGDAELPADWWGLFNWQNLTPFAIASAAEDYPFARSSAVAYEQHVCEGLPRGEDGRRSDSTARPQDRADVARFYAVSSPSRVQLGREAGGRRQGSRSPRTRGPLRC